MPSTVSLNDVTPSPVFNDPANSEFSNFECSAQRSDRMESGCMHLSDLSNFGFSEFSTGVRFAGEASSACRAMPDCILHVAGFSIPAEIRKVAVGGVSVFVAALHTSWARFMEGQQYEIVDEVLFDYSVFRQRNHRVTTVMDGLDQHSSLECSLSVAGGFFDDSRDAFYSSSVRDSIEAGVFWHVSPILFAPILYMKSRRD